MKKLIMLIMVAAICIGCLSACGKNEKSASALNKKLDIVTTIFPCYDWVVNVLGENAGNANVTMLLDKGVDLHSFQPTADDILKISECDLFVYVGGESDEWVDDVLSEAANKDMVVINLLEVLGDSVKEEEVVEGMQDEDEEHEHDHEEDEEHDHDHHEDEDSDHDHDESEKHGHEHHHEEGEVEYDEHVWLSLKSAEVLTKAIADALTKIDPSGKLVYSTASDAYIKKLDDLDKEYEKAVAEGSKKTLLFGDRFPFRYMVDDYGLSYYAAFVGCSAETEASFETISFLAGKVDELSLNTVLTIEGKEHKIAKTIVENTASKDQKILTLDSMQSVTASDVKAGTTYLSVMEENLKVLKEALN